MTPGPGLMLSSAMKEAAATHKFTRILLAVDSSKHSMATVEPVAALAAATGAEVQVLHVWNLEARAVGGHWDVETRTDARALINDVAARITERGVVATKRLDTADRERIPAAIVNAATEFGADLIAVGSRGIDDLHALLFGSVSHHVLHDTDCPVLVVRAGTADQVRPGVRRLLVAVASRDDAEPATEAALAVAQGTGAVVMVVHVRYLTAGEGFAWIEPDADAAEIVGGVVSRLTAAGIDAESRVMDPSPSVAADITGLARSWGADMIVMGSRRPTGLGALLVNSVNHAVIRATDRPVLVAERPATGRR